MITVLGRRNSANVQKVMWTLGELGVPYIRQDIGGSFGYPADYPNPNPVVPTIKDNELVVWESNACVRYLARTYGVGSLWPDEPAALAVADVWMEWQRSGISSAFFPLFMALVRGGDTTPETIERAVTACASCFTHLDAQLAGKQYICGNDLTVADIAIGSMMYRYMTLPIARPELANLQLWYQRLTKRPAYRKHVMIEYGSNPEEWAALERASAGIQ